MKFYVNGVNGGLVRGVASDAKADPPEQTVLDNPLVELFFVDPSTDSYLDYSTHTVKLGIGLLNQYPTGGTFTLSFGGYTTAALAYGISAAAMQSALEGLTSVGAGNVAVTAAIVGQLYSITFQGALALAPQTAMVADPLLLTPLSDAIVSENVVGDATHNEVQSLVLKQFPAVQISNWTNALSTTYAFSGTLELAQYAVLLHLLAQVSEDFVLEIESISPSGRKTTWVQAPITIRTKLIPGGTLNLPVAPTPLNPLYLNADLLTYIFYNSATHKLEFWVEGTKVSEMP